MSGDEPKATALFSSVSTGDKVEMPQTSSSTINSHIKVQSEHQHHVPEIRIAQKHQKARTNISQLWSSWTWSEAM